MSVHITAAGFRPVTWIMGDVDELRAIMVPLSPGVVVDEGKPVADAWITNEPLQIRADGFTYVPQRDWDGRDKDWSTSDGHFELKANLTLRRTDALVPLVAVNPNRDRMEIRFVPAVELGKRQELALQPVCRVHGRCLLQGMMESVEVDNILESASGQSIGFLTTRRTLTPAGLQVDFEMRLPPGDYVLKSRRSSHHAGFTIPVLVPTGKNDLDLGTKTVSATGAVALRGMPAPELDVQWRPGKKTTWEKLRGKVVVLDFWGTWCGPCVNDMPLLMDVADQFRDKPVEWLSIHTPNLKTFEAARPRNCDVPGEVLEQTRTPFHDGARQPTDRRGILWPDQPTLRRRRVADPDRRGSARPGCGTNPEEKARGDNRPPAG